MTGGSAAGARASSPAEVIAAAAGAAGEARQAIVLRWLAARKPEVAVRALLEAADPMPARLRAAAADAARMAGPDGLPGWAAIAADPESWPSSARHARAELHLWGAGAAAGARASDADWHWLAVEAAAAAPDADEALCRLWEAAGDPGGVGGALAWARESGHPEAGRLSWAVTALAASGAPVTVRQGIQLRVTLRQGGQRPWRSVRLPLRLSLAGLHEVIQVLFGWDGDHPHAFTVGATRYSDPFFGLAGTEDEEGTRLRDAFPAGAREPAAHECGPRVHEITRERVFGVGPAGCYPACVAFGGGRAAGAAPFSLPAVNALLAELAAGERL